MMNSKNRHEAEAIIKGVFELIDEGCLHHRIDEPIEEAFKNFGYEETAPATHKIFIQITGDFVRHIYEHGFRPRQITSVSQARAEALAILESGYESLGARGYEAAILDASKGVIRESEILSQTTYAYEHSYVGYGCESAAIGPFCDPSCPVKQWRENNESI